jgi:MtfA peptidase
MRGRAGADVSARVWESAWRSIPLLRRYGAIRAPLLALAGELVQRKRWLPLAGARFGIARRARTALLMALPVAALDVRWYRGFASVLLYPTVFRTRQRELDAAGVVHEWEEWRSGEAWARGPVVLALPEVAASGRGRGYNVVVHECAHQLDLLGDGEGAPPLHRGMSRAAWSGALGAAWADHGARIEQGARTVLDPYAAQAPGEFFAVASEAFFETPRALRRAYPGMYEQFTQFYRLDPLRL